MYLVASWRLRCFYVDLRSTNQIRVCGIAGIAGIDTIESAWPELTTPGTGATCQREGATPCVHVWVTVQMWYRCKGTFTNIVGLDFMRGGSRLSGRQAPLKRNSRLG